MAWLDEAKEAVTEFPADVRSAAEKSYDIVVNDNDRDFDPDRRNFIQAAGTLAAGGFVDFAEDGDLDSVDYAAGIGGAAAGEVGEAWDAIGDSIPYEIRSPIAKKDDSPVDNTPSGNTTETETETGTETDTDTDTETETETETSTETETGTQEPDFAYDSISEGLMDYEGENGERLRNAFMGYSVTALDSQLDDVNYEEIIENTSDYEAQVMEVLEGTDFEDGEFRLGEYGISDERPDGRWLDMDEIGADDDDGDLISYMDELHDEGELEEEMFGYFNELERSDL